MKELTIEQKAKAYDEALERMKSWVKGERPECFTEAQKAAEFIFPELKESDDERMWKLIKKYVHYNISDMALNADHITREQLESWLEKQGTSNPKSALEAWKAMRFEVYQQASGNRPGPNCSDDTTKMFSINDIDEIFEKICEQNPTDKVEPKFHEGAWVVTRYGKVNQVIAVDEDGDGFTLDDCTYFSGSWCDIYHLWTIQDAKDGDVLACGEEILLFKSYSVQGRISLYCWYNGQTNNFHNKEVVDVLLTTRNKVCPATKEQRDLLFQKMTEAGYEWDADKKELKKIEDEPENYKQQGMSKKSRMSQMADVSNLQGRQERK